MSADHAIAAKELRTIRDELAEVYEEARAALRKAHLGGGDLIMLAHPIKAPFLRMYDSLGEMATEIEVGRWAAADADVVADRVVTRPPNAHTDVTG